MSVYVLAVDGAVEKYPYSLTDMRFDNPTVSFPQDIPDELAAGFNTFPVEEVAPPSFNADTHKLIWVDPALAGGTWVQQWRVDPIPQEELDARLEAWRQSASCTPFQGKAALFNAGLLDEVETLISDASTSTLTKLAWSNAIEWRRTSPMIVALAAGLNMTDAQLDELFIAASAIVA